MITVMEKKTDSDLDKEIFAALVSITRKRVNGTDLQGGLMERLAKKLSESYLGVAPASSPVVSVNLHVCLKLVSRETIS